MICPKCNGSHLVRNGDAGSGRQRWRCSDCGHRTTAPLDAPAVPKVEFKTKLPKSARYVITSAQNATPVMRPFLDALLHYCAKVGAKLVVIPFRYKNPTSRWSADNENSEWWAEELTPYLYAGRFDLSRTITILADIKVQATATTPLTGLESITGAKSGVVGHPRVALSTIPTPSHKLPKIMATTGAVTMLNYTDTKAGKKGEFHHSFGAAVVEVSGDVFHIRQISACNDGSFIDLDIEADARGTRTAPPAEALVMGDTHVDFVDPAVVRATFVDKTAICRVVRPKMLVWHDLLDFYSGNHWHRGNPFIAVAKHKSGAGDVRAEVERACAFVKKHGDGFENILVPSNHPDALARWVRETDWRTDPENAAFYLETALVMAQSARMTNEGAVTADPFHHWARKLGMKARFLAKGEGFAIKGIEAGMHGHEGPNGSRGGLRAFSRIGTKSVVGHSHSPGIIDGAHQVGTSTRLRLGYQGGGPSSWLQTHEVIYANGKRSLVNIINGKWRL